MACDQGVHGCAARDSNPEPAEQETGPATIQTVRIRPNCWASWGKTVGLVRDRPEESGGVAARIASLLPVHQPGESGLRLLLIPASNARERRGRLPLGRHLALILAEPVTHLVAF